MIERRKQKRHEVKRTLGRERKKKHVTEEDRTGSRHSDMEKGKDDRF